MDYNQRLSEIWSAPYMQTLPAQIRERGYCLKENNEQKDILFMGFTPTFLDGEKSGNTTYKIDLFAESGNDYFTPIKQILNNGNADLRYRATHADLFYFRENDQNYLKSNVLSCTPFVVDQTNLTMHILEDTIRPKLIILRNGEAAAYFGRFFEEEGWVWMGYRFQHIANTKFGELCRISGLIDSKERIAPEFKSTNLFGTYVLITKDVNQFDTPEERPTIKFLQDILAVSDAEKNLQKYTV